MYFIWFISSALIFKGLSSAADLPCNKRVTQYGFVCVCNSSYCDTVERLSPLSPGKYYLYSTSSTSPGFSRTLGDFSNFSTDAEYSFTINMTMPRQKIMGMGGSFTDAVGSLYNNLSESVQDYLMESYFGPSGIEYSMARMPIGSSDFSPRSYTLDDVPFDYDLNYFNLTYEDLNLKIPLIKKALSLSERGIKLLGCTWNAPVWMKLDNGSTDQYMDVNANSVWAKYHVKFLEAYKAEGVDFWGLSGGNQPFLAHLLPHLFPTVSTVMQQRDWFKNHLKPQLLAANYSDIKLITLEDQRMFAPYWMNRFAADPDAYQALDGVAIHWYFDRFIPSSALDTLHRKHPDKYILYTETSINGVFETSPDKVQLGSWATAAAYAHSIIETFNHWTQSYLDWNLALNTEGGPSLNIKISAPVIINTTSEEFYKQPMFYVMGHFSKFIPPGSRIVQVTSDQPDDNISWTFEEVVKAISQIASRTQNETHISDLFPSNVQCTASANSDGSHSIILLNPRNTTAKVRVEDPQIGSINYDMDAFSIYTIIYWK